MFNLSYAIGNLLRKYDKNTEQLARACKFPEPAIHRWQSGFDQAIGPRHITRLARAFATSPKDVVENHLSLLYGHMRDDCSGPAAKYINIEVSPTALPVVSESYRFQPCRRRSEMDLERIRKHIWYDTTLQKAIHEIAKPYTNKPVPKRVEESK